MARPRTFDEDEVVQKSMIAFWQSGFEGTSVCDLEKATGISRISLYNAFGDKSKLFLRALKSYSDSTADYFRSDEFQLGGLTAILAIFKSAAEDREEKAPEHFGCLMLNTILDLASAGPEAQSIVSETREAMIRGFEANMHCAMSDGKMTSVSRAEIRDRAEFLVGAMWGGRMAVRLHGDVKEARGTANTVVKVVENWRQ